MGQSYLFKRGHRYYFRARVPNDLLSHFDSPVIVKSLHTRYYAEGKRLLRSIAYETEKLFTRIRSGMLTDAQIPKLIREYKDTILSGYAKHREEGSSLVTAGMSGDIVTLDPLQQDIVQTLMPFDEDRTDDDIRWVINQHRDGIRIRRELLMAGKLDDPIRQRAYDLAVRHELDIALPPKSYLNPNEDEYDLHPPREFFRLARAILKAEIEILEVEIGRLQGNDTEYDRELCRRMELPRKFLSEVCSIIQTEKRQLGLAPKSLKKMVSTHQFLLRILGDRDMRDFEYTDIQRAIDVIHKWPSRAYRHKSSENMPIDEVIKRRDFGEPYKTNTLVYLQTELHSIFKFAVEKGWVDRSPCPKRINSIKKKNISPELLGDQNRHLPWSKEEVLRLLETSYFTSRKHRFRTPENFWVPIIALLSGMRQNEICQLYCDDIVQGPANGVTCFRVLQNETRKQRTKSTSSVRYVPVHSELVELGLLDYRDQMVSDGQERLFPNLEYTPDLSNWSTGFSKRFGRHTQRHMVWDDPEQRKVFHGFRSSFIRTLRDDNRVMMEQLQYLTGHKAQHVMPDHYAGKPFVEHLDEWMQKLDYGIDFVDQLGRWADR